MQNGNGHDFETFISPSRGERDFSQVVEDIVEFMTEDSSCRYAVVVGTDSEGLMQIKGIAGIADFVSVITVHRVGKHGRYFWKKNKSVKIFDRHDRMLKEASFSLGLAQKVFDALRPRLGSLIYNFEIHLDIGYNGPTKAFIQEIVGMVTGSGFTARTKPDSYAANKVADRHV